PSASFTLSLHDALPIFPTRGVQHREPLHVRLHSEAYVDELEWTGELGDVLAVARRTEVDERSGAQPPRDEALGFEPAQRGADRGDRKRTRLNSSHQITS